MEYAKEVKSGENEEGKGHAGRVIGLIDCREMSSEATEPVTGVDRNVESWFRVGHVMRSTFSRA